MSIYLRHVGRIFLEIQPEIMIKKTRVSGRACLGFYGRALDSGSNWKKVKQSVTGKIPTFLAAPSWIGTFISHQRPKQPGEGGCPLTLYSFPPFTIYFYRCVSLHPHNFFVSLASWINSQGLSFPVCSKVGVICDPLMVKWLISTVRNHSQDSWSSPSSQHHLWSRKGLIMHGCVFTCKWVGMWQKGDRVPGMGWIESPPKNTIKSKLYYLWMWHYMQMGICR